MRACIRQGTSVLRPMVGLFVEHSETCRDVLDRALRFQDRHALSESDADRIMEMAGVDVTCVEKVKGGEDETFSVPLQTSISRALLWGPFNDLIFDIPSVVKVCFLSFAQPCVACSEYMLVAETSSDDTAAACHSIRCPPGRSTKGCWCRCRAV